MTDQQTRSRERRERLTADVEDIAAGTDDHLASTLATAIATLAEAAAGEHVAANARDRAEAAEHLANALAAVHGTQPKRSDDAAFL